MNRFELNLIYNLNFIKFKILILSSFKLEYLKENEFDGIKTYDYGLPDNIFSNSTLNPDNEGFCSDDCLGNGVFRLHRCQKGLTIITLLNS